MRETGRDISHDSADGITGIPPWLNGFGRAIASPNPHDGRDIPLLEIQHAAAHFVENTLLTVQRLFPMDIQNR